MNKIEYLRVIVNSTCNLSCFFCHKEGVDCDKKSANINIDELSFMIKTLIKQGIKKVKFLGGEPTLCKGLPSLIKSIKEEYPLIDISLISNGIASNETWDELISSGVDRINISLHGFIEDVFKRITGGSPLQLKQVINSIDYLSNKKVLGKVNYVILKGVNEEEFFKVLEFVNEKNLVLDVLNYLSTDKNKLEKYYYSFDEIIKLIASRYDIIETFMFENRFSLPSKRLVIKDGGTINLKTTTLNSVDYLNSCSSCQIKNCCLEGISAIRLTSDGIIKPCIFRDDNCLNFKELCKNNDSNEVDNRIKDYLEKL